MDKRQILIEAAIQVISQKGYAELSLRDIAKAAGVSLSSIHYHFENKDELLIEVVKCFKNMFLNELDQIIHSYSRDKTHDVIEFLIRSVKGRAETHRLWYDLQVLGMYNPNVRSEIKKIRQRFYSLIYQFLFETSDPKRLPQGSQQICSVVFATADGILLQAVMAEDDQEIHELMSQLEMYVKEIEDKLRVAR